MMKMVKQNKENVEMNGVLFVTKIQIIALVKKRRILSTLS